MATRLILPGSSGSDENFQPSSSFTHIHQIKAGDGDAGSPVMRLTPRAGTPELIQVINVDSDGKTHILASGPLGPLKGHWIQARERLIYGYLSEGGAYSIALTDVGSGKEILSFQTGKLDLWRGDTTFSRPRWGIYRSLRKREALRDETVRFADFCLAKGTDDCK